MDSGRTSLWRSRWAAIGAAVAVTLGAGGLLVAEAAPGASESTIVTVTPERIMDTRDPSNIGLPGPFISPVAQKLQVTGSIPTATGTKVVVPTGATGVLLNVTPVNASADGFISIRPGDATGAATTSSLNFTTGNIAPNSVQVALSTSGKIDITYDAYGVAGPTTDILIDVVGYMTNTGLQELVADVAKKANTTDVNAALATKANTADVYTKAQVDAGFLPQGEITMANGYGFIPNGGTPPTDFGVRSDGAGTFSGDGVAGIPIVGPVNTGGVPYGLKSVTYCLYLTAAPGFVDRVQLNAPIPNGSNVADETDRTADGCYTLEVNDSTSSSFHFNVSFGGGGGLVVIGSVSSTWAPTSTLPAPVSDSGTSGGPDSWASES